MSEITCTTRVRVTIEVDGSGPYGLDWSLKELCDQSQRETLQFLQHELQRKRIQIIGTPEIITTAFTRK